MLFLLWRIKAAKIDPMNKITVEQNRSGGFWLITANSWTLTGSAPFKDGLGCSSI